MTTFILCMMAGIINMITGIMSKDSIGTSLGAFLAGICAACIVLKMEWVTL